VRHAKHVILLSVDGMRPDAIGLAETPVIDGFMASGAGTLHARCEMPSITLPCHTSMHLGVPVAVHGVVSNEWVAPDPPVPSLLEIVHKEGLGTCAFYTWEELRDLAAPGVLDYAYYHRLGEPEEHRVLEMGRAAAEYIARAEPALTFVYLEEPDAAGHKHGYMTEQYLDAIAYVDQAMGMVVEAVESAGLLDDTLFVVTSDHGGHGVVHGTDLPEDMTIPWILAGSGVRVGYRITSKVSIVDTAPTILYAMGLEAPASWTGRAIVEAFEA